MSDEKETSILGRSFICNEDLRVSTHAGEPGFLARILLPSYRSLPLSCIERIDLRVDGAVVDPQDITLILNGYSHKLDEMGHLSKIFWFILDKADLFIKRKEPLGLGDHVLEGTMVVVEPYMTVGRFALNYTAKRQLSVATDI
ncbi:MAG: hypothetical protein H6667_09640 [Ardenticatenaceae bacterium]|nr:hypothetical protein [Ardenticatenaceae bacterium]MCB9443444.1 hypothetical protein [Ardenticatenaceae bacterium]